MGEIIAATGDWTGSWTGYGEVDADRYITADLESGRLVELIEARQPAVLCSHWQGFYGMHNEDRAGYRAFQTVVRRLRERDPRGEYTRWRKCSEITDYACMREMAHMEVADGVIELDLPVRVPELTLCLEGEEIRAISVEGKALERVSTRADSRSGRYWQEADITWAVFDPKERRVRVEVLSGL